MGYQPEASARATGSSLTLRVGNSSPQLGMSLSRLPHARVRAKRLVGTLGAGRTMLPLDGEVGTRAVRPVAVAAVLGQQEGGDERSGAKPAAGGRPRGVPRGPGIGGSA